MLFDFILTPSVQDLVAHGRTRQEIAEYIHADDVIFEDLDGPDGLKAACLEAADSKSEVKDFEVGVFCGKYVTGVPEGYFEHLSDLRNGRRGKAATLMNMSAGLNGDASVITSSGTANGPPASDEDDDACPYANGIKTPEHREDIRYVLADVSGKKKIDAFTDAWNSLYNIGSEFPAHEK